MIVHTDIMTYVQCWNVGKSMSLSVCVVQQQQAETANIMLHLLSDDVDDRQPWQNKSKSATESYSRSSISTCYMHID
jgi:hypothetical protein